MTTDDLVPRILAAIEETERLASATIATVNPAKGRWVVAGEYGTEVRDSRGHLVVKHSWLNEIAHIIHNDPFSALRRCVAERALIADVMSWEHAACASQARLVVATPGVGVTSEPSTLPCDCGRDARVHAVLSRLADSYGVAPATEPADQQGAT